MQTKYQKFSNATSTVSTVADVQRIVDEQIAYCRARAADYLESSSAR